LFFQIFHNISLFTPIIPCIVGVIYFKSLEANSKLVLLLLIFACLSQLAPFFLNTQKEIWVFYNSYIIVDVVFWGYIFLQNRTSKEIKLVILIIIITHFVLCAYSFNKYGIETRFYNELVCLDSLAQVIWVLTYFYSLYKNDDVERLQTKPMFWYCLGILAYNPSTYFLFVYYDSVRLSITSQYSYLWRLHDLMNALMYILFSVGMWVNSKKVVYDF
jgi:hypothetical protein